MNEAEKIASMLEWSLEGCNISPQNEALLRAQFAAMPSEEIDRLWDAQMRRRGWLRDRGRRA